MKKIKKNQGFTLIELIISLAMIAIVTASVLQVSRFSDTHKSLTLSVDEVTAAIRTAQSYALSSPTSQSARHICGYGIHLQDAQNYVLFFTYVSAADFQLNPNTCLDESSFRRYSVATRQDVQTYTLESGITITPTTQDVFFVIPYGEVFDETGNAVAPGATITYTITSSGAGANRQIVINSSGKIDH